MLFATPHTPQSFFTSLSKGYVLFDSLIASRKCKHLKLIIKTRFASTPYFHNTADLTATVQPFSLAVLFIFFNPRQCHDWLVFHINIPVGRWHGWGLLIQWRLRSPVKGVSTITCWASTQIRYRKPLLRFDTYWRMRMIFLVGFR